MCTGFGCLLLSALAILALAIAIAPHQTLPDAANANAATMQQLHSASGCCG